LKNYYSNEELSAIYGVHVYLIKLSISWL